jgi:jumonji domain-containing protein 7
VVAGSKTFILMPPGDAFRMHLRRYPQATYQPVAAAAAAAAGGSSNGEALADLLSGSLRLEPVLHTPAEEVLWSSVQPPADTAACGNSSAGPAAGVAAAAAEEAERDLFSDPSLPPPLRVTVQAGEVLYLPALWWHQVGGRAFYQQPGQAGCCAGAWRLGAAFQARGACSTGASSLAPAAVLKSSSPSYSSSRG